MFNIILTFIACLLIAVYSYSLGKKAGKTEGLRRSNEVCTILYDKLN